MKDVLGIVFSNMHEHVVGELTSHRCMGSVPIGGRYRLIDFTLSNLVNSGVEQVGIITKSNYQSLMDHLGNGREWDLSRKKGGLVILPPFGRAQTGMYRGRIDALMGIMEYIKNSGAEYIICADCDMLANMDFKSFFQYHLDTGADLTLMYSMMEVRGDSNKDQSVLDVAADGRVTNMRINPHVTGIEPVFLNVMAATTSFLQRVVEDCYSRSLFSFEKDVLQAQIPSSRIRAWEFDGYVSRFDSLRSYFAANMELLYPDVRSALFPRQRPIYTKVIDLAPVRYGLEAVAENCLVGDGCLIEGEVENSVLFRGVTVEKGAKVRNSVLMQGTSVGENCNLEYVITDKNVSIKNNRVLMGFETYPVFIAKGSVV